MTKLDSKQTVISKRQLTTILARLAGIALAAVFVFAAMPKLGDAVTFAQDISNYQLLPDAAVPYLARAIPTLELVLAVCLVAGFYTHGAALLSLGLLLAFTAGMAQAMWRGIDLDCGCFGQAASAAVGWLSIARNAGLLLLTAVIFLGPSNYWPWRARVARGESELAPNPH